MSKTINYIVKANREFVEAFASLKEARDYVSSYNSLPEVPDIVEIIKQEVKDTVINVYKPEPFVALKAVDLGDEL